MPMCVYVCMRERVIIIKVIIIIEIKYFIIIDQPVVVLLQVRAVYPGIWTVSLFGHTSALMHFLLSVFTGSTELLLQWFDLWGCLSGKTQCALCATAPGVSMTQGCITNSKNKNLINSSVVRCNSLTYWAACRLQALWFSWPYAITTHRKQHRWINHSIEHNHIASAVCHRQKPQTQQRKFTYKTIIYPSSLESKSSAVTLLTPC